MRTEPDCLACFVTQAARTVQRLGGDERQQERAVRAVLEILARVDHDQPPPRIARAVYRAIGGVLGLDDPYAAVKRETTALALAALPGLRRRVAASEDPLRTALLVALAGNIIDFGTGHAFDLEQTIDRVLADGAAVDHISELRRELERARRVLYLADNAGEIVLDRLLLEQIAPGREVTVAVRGGPIINDATLEDARAAGVEGARLIEPGVALPGIDLESSSAAFRRTFDEAELIIAKGQGNYECLVGVTAPAPLFYLFMVKCELVARLTGQPLGSAMVASAALLAAPR